MLNFFGSKKITGFSMLLLLAAPIALLAGCGGGGAAAAGSGTAAPSITVALTDSTGAATTSISSGAPATVKATVKDSKGAVVAGAVVTFSTDATLATIDPASKTALTDANGVATVTLSAASLTAAGAATITASTQMGTPATAVTGSTNYSVSGIATLTVALTGSAGATISSISSSAPATVKATVKYKGAGVAGVVVKFSTDATLGTVLPASALTDANGVATATLSPASLTAAGAATITATSQVGTPATEVTGSIGYSVSATSVSNITIAMTNSAGAAVTSISSGAPATVKATVKDTAGAGVANAVVTFSTDATLATIAPVSKTALTDSSGVAIVTLSAASLTAAGAATITASTQVGTTAVTGSKGYSVGAAAVTITPPAFGLASLSAFGTTSVSVTVSSNGAPVTTPQTVSFTSPCASSGKAVLTPSVTTVNGIATASYRDNGCAGTDTITASVSGITSSSATLAIAAPATGSIQFVSATPASITLKGMGGVGRQESSQVIFKVVDTAGNPIGGKTVNFSLSTAVGGIVLTTATAISDPTTGQVVVGVNAGTVSTPVRVIASTCTNNTSPCTGTLLTTQSDQLTITTGIPDQQNFSLSATILNIEGWNYDGTTTVLNARLADHFNNPVPDGTAVNFIAEGGKVQSSCSTTTVGQESGVCSVTLVSQNLRPSNGRVEVLAYAVGEEGFTDLNGNGLADNPVEMIDANGASTDMPEAFVDYNENGIRDANEPFIDFNQDGTYNNPDGKYNGVLCNANAAPGSSATACSAQKGIHVRRQMPIVFSGSDAIITINGGYPINLPRCSTGAETSPPGPGGAPAPLTFTVTVVDKNGNAMPAGTTIAFETDNGTFPTGFDKAYTVPSTNGCRSLPTLPYPGSSPSSGSVACTVPVGSATFGDIPVTMKSNATWTAPTPPAISPGVCADTNHFGTFSVKVTTPNNVVTTATQDVWD